MAEEVNKELEATIKAATEEIVKKADELNVQVVAYLEVAAQGIVPRIAVIPKEENGSTTTDPAASGDETPAK